MWAVRWGDTRVPTGLKTRAAARRLFGVQVHAGVCLDAAAQGGALDRRAHAGSLKQKPQLEGCALAVGVQAPRALTRTWAAAAGPCAGCADAAASRQQQVQGCVVHDAGTCPQRRMLSTARSKERCSRHASKIGPVAVPSYLDMHAHAKPADDPAHACDRRDRAHELLALEEAGDTSSSWALARQQAGEEQVRAAQAPPPLLLQCLSVYHPLCARQVLAPSSQKNRGSRHAVSGGGPSSVCCTCAIDFR